MAHRHTARSATRIFPGIPGSAPTVNGIVISAQSAYIARISRTKPGIPGSLFITPEIYGIDTPLFNRNYSNVRTGLTARISYTIARTQAAYLRKLRKSRPLNITAAAPDITPIEFSRVSGRFRQRQRVRQQKLLNARWAQVSQNARNFEGSVWAIRTLGTTYSINSCSLLSEIQRHMLESTIDGGITWELWDQAEILGYLNQRLNRFILESGLTRKSTAISVGAGDEEADMPSDLIDIRRLSWGTDGTLVRSDEYQYFYGLGSGTVPEAYTEYNIGSLKVKLLPTPSAAGTLQVLYVPTVSTISSTCSLLEIPNVFTPYIKWGVIADMLSGEGEGRDTERAQYAEARFSEGVEMAKALIGRGNDSD